MSKLLIVTCTKAQTDKEFEQRPIYQSFKKQYESNSNIEPFIFKNNNKGLSTCYNEILKNPENLDKNVLFVHDDVVLEDIFLYEKVMSSRYSITGLAGTKSFDKKVEKSAWHLCSTSREDFVGEVAHIKDNKIWTTVFGPTSKSALIIDGLFIACKIKDLVEKEVYFIEDFDFHHYDMAFCLKAYEKRVSVGVQPIRVVHHGLGDSMMSQDWELSNQKFQNYFCK